MNVSKFHGLLMLALAAALSAGTAPAADGDPQSMLLEARAALQRGDAGSAEAAVSAIRGLIEADPYWDPDRSFTEVLIPEIEVRIANLKGTLAQLEALSEKGSAPREIPPASDDPEDISPYIDRASARIESIEAELERIVETVPPGRERCALLRSDSYTRAAGLARTEILPELSEDLNSRIAELWDGDERVRALKTKLDALKREVMASSVEREDLEEALAGVRDDQRAFQRTVIEFIGSDPETLEELELALAHRIHDIWQELRPLEGQSPLDKEFCQSTIDRFRLANVVNVAHGGRDLTGRINALQTQLDSVPAIESGTSSSTAIEGSRSACRR
jgi:hypothetical protein